MHFVNRVKGLLLTGATLVLVMPLFPVLIQGQEPKSASFSDDRSVLVNTCESNRFRLEDVNSFAGKDGTMILIARLGKGEQSISLNHRRLHNARIYLSKFLLRKPDTIIVAEGERVMGRGRIEVYVGGKLVDAFGVGTNQDFYIGTCEWGSKADKNLYNSRRGLKK